MVNSEEIKVSIILVNYKTAILTGKCISSITASETRVSYEIIVIDNDSQDNSVEWLGSCFPNIIIENSGKNKGFAFGNNCGVRLAHGRYLLLLNNDTVVKKGMIDALYKYAEEGCIMGLFGCRAVDRNGVELPVAHRYEDMRRIWLQTYIKPLFERAGIQRRLINILGNKTDRRLNFIPAQWIAGSAMFIKRDLYYRIGGLDENFFMYMEDEDLCHRVKDAGYQVGIIPFMGYVHYCGGSTIQSYFLTKEYIKSRLIFFKRYEPQNFSKIKKQLYKQIPVINTKISKLDINKMRKELDVFVAKDLAQAAQAVMGIK